MKKNKIYLLRICFLLLFYALLHIIFYNFIFASDKNLMKIKVPSAVVMDMESERILFEQNANEKRPMASLTKIMTSILLVEHCNLEEQIEIPKEATNIGGSTAGIKKGDTITAKNLLYGMMLPSR